MMDDAIILPVMEGLNLAGDVELMMGDGRCCSFQSCSVDFGSSEVRVGETRTRSSNGGPCLPEPSFADTPPVPAMLAAGLLYVTRQGPPARAAKPEGRKESETGAKYGMWVV